MPSAWNRLAAPLLPAAVLLLAGAGGAERPVVDPATELMIRLDRLLSFIEWPEDAFPAPGAPLVLGLAGEVPFSPEALERCTVAGRPIRVERMVGPDAVNACHVLWIGEGVDASRWSPPATTLTVSNRAGFVGTGGMIEIHPGATPELDLGALGRSRLGAHPHLIDVSQVRR